MKPHDAYLELAAVAIDFPLTASERAHLDGHLVGCAACTRSVAGLYDDALALEALPALSLPERRGAEILAAVLHPHAVGHPLRVLAVVALLGLLLIGTLVAGGELLRDRGDNPFVVVPPVSLESPSPGETPGTAVVPSPTPTASPTPSPIAPPAAPVLHMGWIVDTGTRQDATVVMADGLTVWNDPEDGMQERQLSPTGIDWVRDQLEANGLLDVDAVHEAKQKPGTDPPGGGATSYTFVADRDGLPVTVRAWIPSSGIDERYWTASDTLLRLAGLGAQVVDADAWIPAEYWADAAAPYEPDRYMLVVALGREAGPSTRKDVDTIDWPLPVPPDEYGDQATSLESEGEYRCAVIDSGLATDIARAQESTEQAVASTLRGREHFYGWSRGGGELSVFLYPLLPDEFDCAARYSVPGPPALGDEWTEATGPVVTGARAAGPGQRTIAP